MSVTFDTVETIAPYAKMSRRSVHELTRLRAIPHRKLPGQRRILFVREEVERYLLDPTIELETIELDRGGRIVRPKEVA